MQLYPLKFHQSSLSAASLSTVSRNKMGETCWQGHFTSVGLLVCARTHKYIYIHMYTPIDLSIYPSIHQSIHPSIHLSICACSIHIIYIYTYIHTHMGVCAWACVWKTCANAMRSLMEHVLIFLNVVHLSLSQHQWLLSDAVPNPETWQIHRPRSQARLRNRHHQLFETSRTSQWQATSENVRNTWKHPWWWWLNATLGPSLDFIQDLIQFNISSI
jgi:hypothetical protein